MRTCSLSFFVPLIRVADFRRVSRFASRLNERIGAGPRRIGSSGCARPQSCCPIRISPPRLIRVTCSPFGRNPRPQKRRLVPGRRIVCFAAVCYVVLAACIARPSACGDLLGRSAPLAACSAVTCGPRYGVAGCFVRRWSDYCKRDMRSQV